jgi:hypothetical protein
VTKVTESVVPDVEKAKREDLQKLQKNPFESETKIHSSPKIETKTAATKPSMV